LFGVDHDDDHGNHGMMLMESVIHAYIMLNHAAHKSRFEVFVSFGQFHDETLRGDGVNHPFNDGVNNSVNNIWFHGIPREHWSLQWSAIISIACDYHDLICETPFQRHGDTMVIGRYCVDRYLDFLVAEMRTLVDHRGTWVVTNEKRYYDDWYVEMSRIIALFIQGIECFDLKDDAACANAQEFAILALRDSGLLTRCAYIDWERFVSNSHRAICSEYISEFLSGCTYEKFDKFISMVWRPSPWYGELRAALGKHFNWGDDYMVVAKRAEKAEKLKRLRDSLDAYTDDGEDDPELKKMRLYLEQKSTQISC
jgi:hypothetical protein